MAMHVFHGACPMRWWYRAGLRKFTTQKIRARVQLECEWYYNNLQRVLWECACSHTTMHVKETVGTCNTQCLI